MEGLGLSQTDLIVIISVCSAGVLLIAVLAITWFFWRRKKKADDTKQKDKEMMLYVKSKYGSSVQPPASVFPAPPQESQWKWLPTDVRPEQTSAFKIFDQPTVHTRGKDPRSFENSPERQGRSQSPTPHRLQVPSVHVDQPRPDEIAGTQAVAATHLQTASPMSTPNTVLGTPAQTSVAVPMTPVVPVITNIPPAPPPPPVMNTSSPSKSGHVIPRAPPPPSIAKSPATNSPLKSPSVEPTQKISPIQPLLVPPAPKSPPIKPAPKSPPIKPAPKSPPVQPVPTSTPVQTSQGPEPSQLSEEPQSAEQTPKATSAVSKDQDVPTSSTAVQRTEALNPVSPSKEPPTPSPLPSSVAPNHIPHPIEATYLAKRAPHSPKPGHTPVSALDKVQSPNNVKAPTPGGPDQSTSEVFNPSTKPDVSRPMPGTAPQFPIFLPMTNTSEPPATKPKEKTKSPGQDKPSSATKPLKSNKKSANKHKKSKPEKSPNKQNKSRMPPKKVDLVIQCEEEEIDSAMMPIAPADLTVDLSMFDPKEPRNNPQTNPVANTGVPDEPLDISEDAEARVAALFDEIFNNEKYTGGELLTSDSEDGLDSPTRKTTGYENNWDAIDTGHSGRVKKKH